jgi:ribosome-binding protein aMBF1 (putative translation factor)
MTTTARTIYEEFAQFITSAPSLEQLAEYRLSHEINQRVNTLLDANRSRALTAEEQAELDEFIQVNHLMQLIKDSAAEKLAQV